MKEFKYFIATCIFTLTLIGECFAEPSIAVLNFRNLNKQAKEGNYGPGITAMLTSSLANTGKFKVIERVELQKVLSELKTSLAGIFDQNTIKELGKVSGVKYVVAGGISRFDTLSEIEARILDAETGEILYADSATCEKDSEIRNVLNKLTENIIDMTSKPISRFEKRIAIFPFDDGQGGAALGESISEMLTTYILKNTSLKVVERANLDKIIEEQKLGLTDIMSPEGARKIGKLLAIDVIILGNATVFGDYCTVDARAVNVETGEVLVTESTDLSKQEPLRKAVAKLEMAGKKLQALYQGEGFLVVNSEPSEAIIYLDEQEKGQTPLRIDNVSNGRHTLRLSKKGYSDDERTIIVGQNETQNLNIKLSSTILFEDYERGILIDSGEEWTKSFEIEEKGTHKKISLTVKVKAGTAGVLTTEGSYSTQNLTSEADKTICWVSVYVDNEEKLNEAYSYRSFVHFSGGYKGSWCDENKNMDVSFYPFKLNMELWVSTSFRSNNYFLTTVNQHIFKGIGLRIKVERIDYSS